MTSDPVLRRWMLAAVKQHFPDYNLPLDNIVIYWEPCGRAAATTALEDEEYVIRVDPALLQFPRHAKKDIRHELVHVHLWKEKGLADHGRRFDEEIARLCGFRSYRRLL